MRVSLSMRPSGNQTKANSTAVLVPRLLIEFFAHLCPCLDEVFGKVRRLPSQRLKRGHVLILVRSASRCGIVNLFALRQAQSTREDLTYLLPQAARARVVISCQIWNSSPICWR